MQIRPLHSTSVIRETTMLMSKAFWRLTVVVCVIALNACASTNGKQLLPDDALTTEQIVSGELAGGGRGTKYRMTKPLAIPDNTGNSTTLRAIEDLNRDFQRIPNPQIVGYVYPHRSAGAPIPGYMTVFTLYEKEHYALTGEGLIQGK